MVKVRGNNAQEAILHALIVIKDICFTDIAPCNWCPRGDVLRETFQVATIILRMCLLSMSNGAS